MAVTDIMAMTRDIENMLNTLKGRKETIETALERSEDTIRILKPNKQGENNA